MFDPHIPESPSPDPRKEDSCRAWEAMSDWLIDSVSSMPAGGVLDLGPADHDESASDIEDVPCAQILMLRNQKMMVRLSTDVMGTPSIAGYAVPRVMLDRWNYEDRFVDCTHGYLLTRSVACVADICVSWFRDRRAIATPAALGCSYTTPMYTPQGRAIRPEADRGDP